MMYRLIRWPEAVPLQSADVDIVSTAFYRRCSDDSQFEGEIFVSLVAAWLRKCEDQYRSLKSALMCQGKCQYTEILDLVLFGLLAVIKEDIGYTSAELIYGTSLRILGEFMFTDSDAPESLGKFREQLKQFNYHQQHILGRIKYSFMSTLHEGLCQHRTEDHTTCYIG